MPNERESGDSTASDDDKQQNASKSDADADNSKDDQSTDAQRRKASDASHKDKKSASDDSDEDDDDADDKVDPKQMFSKQKDKDEGSKLSPAIQGLHGYLKTLPDAQRKAKFSKLADDEKSALQKFFPKDYEGHGVLSQADFDRLYQERRAAEIALENKAKEESEAIAAVEKLFQIAPAFQQAHGKAFTKAMKAAVESGKSPMDAYHILVGREFASGNLSLSDSQKRTLVQLPGDKGKGADPKKKLLTRPKFLDTLPGRQDKKD